MITFSNIRQWKDVPFKEYLNAPGYSHSWLKAQKMGVQPVFNETYKVRIGKLVDGILTEPTTVNMSDPLYSTAKVIAAVIKAKWGPALAIMQTQLSYTADLEYNGFVMPGKFRLDYLLPKIAVIDLKVTFQKDVHALIDYMGYINQMHGYCGVAEVKQAYILAQRCKEVKGGKIVPLGEPQLISLPMKERNEFWEENIMLFGKVTDAA